MAAIGFHFNNIQVDKKGPIKGKVQVAHNLGIENVTEKDARVGAKVTALDFDFKFDLVYEPQIGSINMKGTISLLMGEEPAKAALEEWATKKSLPQDLMQNVLNAVFSRGITYAMQLAREVNLPSPVPLPKLSVGKKPEATSSNDTVL